MDLKTAVVVIDMVNDFVTGRLGFKGALDVIPNVRSLLAAARANGVPIVYVCDAHAPGDPEIRVWGEHSMAGTDASRVVAELAPQRGEPVLPKHTYDAFFRTRLGAILRRAGAEEVVLVGVVAHICVQNSAAGAFFNGYDVVVPRDCVTSSNERACRYALGYMRRVYGAKITNSRDVIEGMRK